MRAHCTIVIGLLLVGAPAATDASAEAARNTILCRYVDHAPAGVAGWDQTGWVDDSAYGETRFRPYGAAADELATDVHEDRGAGGPADGGRHTAFSMVYDQRGWHIYVFSGEPEIAARLDDGTSPGKLEMAFSPGDAGAYHQWIIDLSSQQISVYDWDTPHRHYRSLRGHIQTETRPLKDGYGTHIFIPWISLYDKLPFDTGPWAFSLIRWAPGGGVSWGGKVHEIGRWGLVQWQPPAPETRQQLLRGLIRQAWGVYQKQSPTLIDYWGDAEIGDPLFYTEQVAPTVRRLEAPGEAAANLDSLSADKVEELFSTAVPEWLEFDHVIDELRRHYLRQMLLTE